MTDIQEQQALESVKQILASPEWRVSIINHCIEIDPKDGFRRWEKSGKQTLIITNGPIDERALSTQIRCMYN